MISEERETPFQDRDSVEGVGIDERSEIEDGDGPETRDVRTETVADQAQEIDPGGPDPR